MTQATGDSPNGLALETRLGSLKVSGREVILIILILALGGLLMYHHVVQRQERQEIQRQLEGDLHRIEQLELINKKDCRQG